MLTFSANDFGPNFSGAGSLTNLDYTFESVGAASAGGPFPDVSNWDVSNVTSLLSVFEDMNVNSDPNFAGWTLSGITNGTALTDFIKSSAGITNLDVSTFNFPNTVTSLDEFAANSDIVTIDFGVGSTSDFSNVTTLLNFANASGSLQEIIWPASLDLSSLTDATSMINAGALMSPTSYDLFLTVLDSTGPAGAYTLDAGGSLFTPTIISEGNDTAGAAFSLTDATADFITDGVAIGDIVYNRTIQNTYAEVTVVVSLTELTLDVSIMNNGDAYQVQSSAATKARYSLVGKGWIISDAGPV